MRRLSLLAVLLASACYVSGDTIRFKDGISIDVDKAIEHDGQVDYWLGATKYTISQDSIEKIIRGGGPSISFGAQTNVNMVPPSAATDAVSTLGPSQPESTHRAKIAVPAQKL